MKTVLKKGDILVGYRGTEVEFYEIVRVTPKTVLLVSIQKKLVDVSGIEYTAAPILGSGEGTPFRRWIFPSGLSGGSGMPHL